MTQSAAPSSTSLDTAAPSRGRGLNITLWVLQVLFAVLFIFAGSGKLRTTPEVVENFDKIGLGQWFRYLTGTLEMAGGLGLLIPRLSGLAALGLSGVMVGAVLTHLLVLPPAIFALGPAVFCLLLDFIAWGRWPQTKALFGGTKR
ncbi:DoxX family protein [Myxococcaceae bacterium JPH2]|nr:DoxX family protein [Myxococcaceae bacterium JPH2]